MIAGTEEKKQVPVKEMQTKTTFSGQKVPFPGEWYAKVDWQDPQVKKVDWGIEGGGPELPELEMDSEEGCVPANLMSSGMRKVLKQRPKVFKPGDFIAWANDTWTPNHLDPTDVNTRFKFFVGKVKTIRHHSLFIHYYGDDPLGPFYTL